MVQLIRPLPFVNGVRFFLFGAALILALFFTGVEGRLFFASQVFLWLFLTLTLLFGAGRITIPRSVVFWSLVLLEAVIALALIWSPVPAYTQSMVWRHGSVLVVLFAFVAVTEDCDWSWVKTFLQIVTGCLILYALWQYLNGNAPKATFLNKNSLAGFLLPLVFWLSLSEEGARVKLARLLLLFGCGLTLGLIGSRGALLGLLFGGSLLCLGSWRGQLSLMACARPVFALIGGLIFSLPLTGLQGGVTRMATLADSSAGAARFYIWQGSWQMLEDAPWYGIGTGLYGLLFPRYRLPEDGTAGHFAHNDLLQFLIETGWPGGIALTAFIVALVFSVWSTVGTRSLAEAQRYEITLLMSGLGALCFHSLFTYHFYVYGILIVYGVVLGRVQVLMPASIAKPHPLDLERFGRLMPYVPVLCCVLPLFFIVTGLCSQVATVQALNAVAKDDMETVAERVAFAKKMWPSNDFNWYMEGELLRIGLSRRGEDDGARSAQLFERASANFQRAFDLNPYRAMIPHKQALLIESSAEKGEPGQVEGLYKSALAIDPLYWPGRMDLARYYLKQGNTTGAGQVLADGLKYKYPVEKIALPYLKYTRDLLLQQGDDKRVGQLEERIQMIEARAGK